MDIVIVGASFVALAGLILGRHLWLLAFPRQTPRFDDAWLGRFSLARYRPLGRLLAEADFEFLMERGHVGQRIVKELRTERRKVFRAYVRDLARDFHRLQGAAKLLLLESGEDRPDLAAVLLKQQLVFALAMLSVEWRLLLNTLGLASVDTTRLLGVVDGLRSRIALPLQLPA